MNEKQLLKMTDKMDKLGKKKYTLKYGGIFALGMFIFMLLDQTFIDPTVDYVSFSTYIISKQFLNLIIVGLIIFPIAGYLYGWWQWKYYHKKKEKMMRNK